MPYFKTSRYAETYKFFSLAELALPRGLLFQTHDSPLPSFFTSMGSTTLILARLSSLRASPYLSVRCTKLEKRSIVSQPLETESQKAAIAFVTCSAWRTPPFSFSTDRLEGVARINLFVRVHRWHGGSLALVPLAFSCLDALFFLLQRLKTTYPNEKGGSHLCVECT